MKNVVTGVDVMCDEDGVHTMNVFHVSNHMWKFIECRNAKRRKMMDMIQRDGLTEALRDQLTLKTSSYDDAHASFMYHLDNYDAFHEFYFRKKVRERRLVNMRRT